MNNVFSRLKEVFTKSFLWKLSQEKSAWPTWKFWFFWNFVFTLIFSLVTGTLYLNWVNDLKERVEKNIPDQAKFEITNGRLKIDGIEQPLVIKNEKDKSLFLVDTKSNFVDDEVLDNYNKGVIISSEKIISKNNKFEKREFDVFKEEKSDISYTGVQLKEKISKVVNFARIILAPLLFIMVLFYTSVVSLFFVLLWAFVFWIISLFFKLKNADFGKIFFATMHFYFIPIIFSYILSAYSWFFTFVILLVLFLFNLAEFRKLEEKEKMQMEKVFDESKKLEKA